MRSSKRCLALVPWCGGLKKPTGSAVRRFGTEAHPPLHFRRVADDELVHVVGREGPLDRRPGLHGLEIHEPGDHRSIHAVVVFDRGLQHSHQSFNDLAARLRVPQGDLGQGMAK